MMKIFFIGATPQARVYKQVKALQAKYRHLKIYLVCYRYDKILFDNVFEKVFILKDSNPYDEVKALLNLHKPNIIHFFSDKYAIAKPIIDSNIPYVFDPYDYFLEQASLSKSQLIAHWQEIVYNAKGLVIRYDESIRDNPFFKLLDISQKRVIQLFDYCLEDFFVNIDLKDKIQNSIVHIGYVSNLSLPKHLYSPTQFDKVAHKLVSLDYKYTIYSSLWSSKYDELLKSYSFVLTKYPDLFNIYPAVEQKKLNHTISKYQYGSYLHQIDKEYDISAAYIQNSVGNKLFNYLEALLPVLSTPEFKSTANLIKRYNIGTVMDLDNFDDIIKKANDNYEIYFDKILNLRKNQFNIYNHIQKLYDIYKDIA